MKRLPLLLLLLVLSAAPSGLRAATPTGGDLVQMNTGTLVLIHNAEGAGSGFLATQGGKPYLFTNIHVAAEAKGAAFTLLDGTRLTPVSAEAAVGHDIMRFALRELPARTLPTTTDLGAAVKVGDEVFVLGNSGGGGVVTSLPGRIVGIGPDRLEVTSEFIPGNSGSPIIHAASNLAIGIATYLTKRPDEFSGQRRSGTGGGNMVIRRFGYRLDSVKTWQPVNWTEFQAEADQMRQVERLSGDIMDFFNALASGRQPKLGTDGLSRAATSWRQKMSTPHLSEADRLAATQNFLGSLRAMVHSDIASLEPRLRYDYFQNQLREARQIRDRMYEDLDKQSQQLAMPSSRGR